MRKVAIISALGILVLSCSVTRKFKGEAGTADIGGVSENIFESVKNQNLTDSSFYIQKAEFEIVSKEVKEKYLGTIKYEKPDKYLVSIKSRTGIEGARIFITNDTVLANDRINKKMYFGRSFYLKKKYGLTESCLPLIFGDLISEKNQAQEQLKCQDNEVKLSSVVRGVKLNYEIDCKKRKVVLVKQTDNFGEEILNISYGKFFKIGGILLPGMVEIKDEQFDIIIKIRILRIEYPWKGTVNFIPGKGYESIELL